MKKVIMISLFLTAFSLPVFAQFEVDENGNVVVEAISRELLEEMYKHDWTTTAEEKKEIFDKIYEDGVLTEEEFKKLYEDAGKREEAMALKIGCITQEKARAFAKEYMLEQKKQYEGERGFYDVEGLLGASGRANSWFSIGSHKWCFFLRRSGMDSGLIVSVSCDGSKVRTQQGSNR